MSWAIFRRAALLFPLAALSAAPRSALAQVGDLPDTQREVPGPEAGVDIATKLPYWGAGETRPFISASFDAGIVFYRAALAAGYGKPHWSWAGVEGYAVASPSGGTYYAGVRGTLPQFEARVGARYVFTMDEYLLKPQESYVRLDTEYENTERSRYGIVEAQISGSISVADGAVFGAATFYAVFGEPEPYYLYEELVKIIMAPPYLARLRAGYIAQPTWEGTIKVGALGEVLVDPQRGAFHVRAGPALSVALTHHLDVTGAIMVTVSSPDSIGLLGADLGAIALRYKWATGDKWPEFP